MININKVIKNNMTEEEYRKIIKELNDKNNALEMQITNIYCSRSWQLTLVVQKFLGPPFRVAKSVKRRITKRKEKNHYQKNIKNYKYNFKYEDNTIFNNKENKTDIKALAFYLPQFHTFKENDEWWGKGFTEWTNTKKAKPRFENHYQPREPHKDFGYYVLDNKETIQKQVKLAKEHGLYGFCFYYYWFSGKRLLEKPVDIFLENKDIDFPFCLCWANENWTRRWDGLDKEVLIEQKYTEEDPINFIKDIKKYLDDKRYIKINNKPVILVYNPTAIKDFDNIVKIWKETAKEIGIGEIVIISKFDTNYYQNVDYNFDFAPNIFGTENNRIGKVFDGYLFDYKNLVTSLKYSNYYQNTFDIKKCFNSCTLGWDNSPRRKSDYCAFINYDPKYFYEWLRLIIDAARTKFEEEERFIFINAWNEWAEGTYLEPDQKFGYTNINTLSKAIYDIPYDDSIRIFKEYNKLKNKNIKLAIQYHIFYTDLLDEVMENLNSIPFKYDLYVSTNEEEKKEIITKKLKNLINCNHLEVTVFDNCGRDIGPMIKQMQDKINNYQYFGHFHTKKTLTTQYGKEWRHYLYTNLFGDEKNIETIFNELESDSKIGIIYPITYEKVNTTPTLDCNLKGTNKLLKLMNLPQFDEEKETIEFPAGSMFWARTKAISKLFEMEYDKIKFPKEANQKDATPAHAIERLLGIVPNKIGYKNVSYICKYKDKND